MLTLCFDCQKNQVLPKIPDQVAYYSRQLYIYNFTIVHCNEHNKLDKDSVFIYNWTEDQRPKGSNEIASAVHFCLTGLDNTNIDTVRLVTDGCGGQNKNSIMIGMVSTWFTCSAPSNVKSVQLIFPVTGHSYLPPDRVFGNIEKAIKRKETVVEPQEYRQVFESFGSVRALGDCLLERVRLETCCRIGFKAHWTVVLSDIK
jgi:hypothetical protein